MKKKRGFVLLIALVLVFLITMYSVKLLEFVVEALKNAGNFEAVEEAYYAAEGEMEMGLVRNKLKGGPGYEASGSIDYTDFNGARATWKIIGRTTCLRDKPLSEECAAGASPDVFYIPRPSTGTAGEKCDPLRVYAEDTDGDGWADAGHPCNWGKLHVGDAISIPLWRMVNPDDPDDVNADQWDPQPDGILDPEELDIKSFTIRVRTPCKDGKATCDESERYVLDTSYDTEYPSDGDTLMIWEIVGKCIKNDDGEEQECYLTQIDDEDPLELEGKSWPANSEIYADLINDAASAYGNAQYVVLQSNAPDLPDYGEDNFNFRGEIIYFLRNGIAADDPSDYFSHAYNVSDSNLSWDWDLRRLHKPFLHLSVIHSLKDDTFGDPQNIPYLEYQIIIESGLAPADMHQTVVGEGYSQSSKQSVEAKKGYDVGVLRYVIQN